MAKSRASCQTTVLDVDPTFTVIPWSFAVIVWLASRSPNQASTNTNTRTGSAGNVKASLGGVPDSTNTRPINNSKASSSSTNGEHARTQRGTSRMVSRGGTGASSATG